MGVMGRKKQMIANIIAGREIRTNKALQERREKEKGEEQEKGQEVSEEEHQKRLKLLKDMGILKEEIQG